MSTHPLQHSGTRSRAGPYRLAWACLPVMLALGGLVLVLFGLSWWTLLTAILLLGCPAAMAAAIYLSLQPLSGPEREDGQEDSGK